MFKLSFAAISCEVTHMSVKMQSACSMLLAECCAPAHCENVCTTKDILECDIVSTLNNANRRYFALKCLLQLEILGYHLSVVPVDSQHCLFNFHIYNDVISDVIRNTN